MNKKIENLAFLLFFATLMAPLSMEIAPSIRIYLFDLPLVILYFFFYMRLCLRQTRLTFGLFDLVFAIFYAWLVIASLQGKGFDISLEWLLYWLRGYLIILYMRHTIGTIITEKVFFYAIGFCLVVEPMLAILQAITQSSIGVVKQYFGVKSIHHSNWKIYGEQVTRAQGTFEHTNYLGNWLIMLMPFLQTRMIDERKKIRLLYVLWWFLCLVVLILTFSRANWMAFLLGFAVVTYFDQRYEGGSSRWPKWSAYLLIPTIIVLICYTLFTEKFEFFVQLLETRIGRTFADNSSNIRSDLLYGAVTVMEGNLFLGVGLGHSNAMIIASNAYIPKSFNATVHNIFMIITTESGVIGGILFVIIIHWPLFLIWKTLRRSSAELRHETLNNAIAFMGCFTGLYFAMLWYVGMLEHCEFPLIMTLVGSALGIGMRVLQMREAVETNGRHVSAGEHPLARPMVSNAHAMRLMSRVTT